MTGIPVGYPSGWRLAGSAAAGAASLAIRIVARAVIYLLLLLTVIEVYATMTGLVHELAQGRAVLRSLGALAAVSVPAGAVVFWVGKAIAARWRATRVRDPRLKPAW
jgi:hypothetical protein